jgi:hypothetical protein
MVLIIFLHEPNFLYPFRLSDTRTTAPAFVFFVPFVVPIKAAIAARVDP